MAVGGAHVFPGFMTPVLTQISFQSHRLVFSHASAEVRGKNTWERNFASAGFQTHNHQVTSSTYSRLSHPDGAHTRLRLYSLTHDMSFLVNYLPDNPKLLQSWGRSLLKTL